MNQRTQDRPVGALRRTSRRTFKAGSVVFVFIGLLHTYVQLTDLSTSQVRADVGAIGELPQMRGATAWEIWQGVGLLFGFVAITVGLINLASLRGRPTTDPDLMICAINVVLLIAITTIGYLYLGPLQLFGGPVGVVMFGLPIIAAWRGDRMPKLR